LHRIEARIHELDAMVAALSVEDAQLLNGLLNAIR